VVSRLFGLHIATVFVDLFYATLLSVDEHTVYISFLSLLPLLLLLFPATFFSFS